MIVTEKLTQYPNKFVWEDGNGAVYRHFRNETVNSSTDCVVLSRDDGTWLSTQCNQTQICYICRGTGKSKSTLDNGTS